MSTTGREWHSVLRIFKGRRGRTGHHATCALDSMARLNKAAAPSYIFKV
ncbi:unnamed protein product [Prunus brigantina]